MSRRTALSAAAIAAFLFAAPAAALTVSLGEAVERALDHDPRIDEQRQYVELARAMLQEAKGSGGIRIDLNSFVGLAPAIDGGFFENEPCGVTTQCVVRDDRYDIGDSLSLWNYLEFTIIKPVHTFGKIEHFSAAAESNIDIKQADVRLQRGNTLVDVSSAYYGHLTARDSRLFLEDMRKRVTDAEAMVRRWLEEGGGEVSQGDLYAIQAGAALLNKYIAQARALEAVSLAGLRTLMGLDADTSLELADSRIRPVDLPAQDLAALQRQALEQRPEMRQLDRGLHARRQLVEANKAMGRPNLYVGVAGLISYSPNRDRLDNPYISDPFNDWGGSPIMGLQWQWQPAVTQAKTAQARAELDALIAKSTLARQGIPFEVAEQYHQALEHRRAVEELENGSKSARRWMISRYTDFEAGVASADKLVTAFQGYIMAHTEYLRTVYDYNMYVVKLNKVIGAYQ